MTGKKYKLLMIIGLFYPDVGGTEKACQILAKKLSELDFDVTILTTYREGLPPYEIIDGLPVYRYIKGWHLFEFTYMISVLSFLIKNIKRINGILCFGLYLFTAPAVLFGRFTGKKIFFRLGSARETGDLQRISKLKFGRFVLQCSKYANGAIAMTNEIEAELLKKKYPSEKIVRIPNAVDTQKFSPDSPRSEDPFIICYIGRLAKGKGLEILIKAFSTLRTRTERFNGLIVGNGELKTSLIKQVNQLRLQTHVSFVGEVDDVVPFYHQSHVFVLPSFSEGMPLALLEAMACGVCVVATNVGGIVDILGTPEQDDPTEQGYRVCKNGIVFTPGDDSALSSILLVLMNDPPLRQHLVNNALQTIGTTYALRRVAPHYLDLFKLTREG